MGIIDLTRDEKHILVAYMKTSPLVLIRLKSQALLLKDKRVNMHDIADVLRKSVRTIERWVQDFRAHRTASIFTGHADNENASKLSSEQKEQIRTVLQQSPSVQGLPKEFWDVPQLKTYIQARFGVKYDSVQSYHFLLKFSNLSFKYPSTFDIHRNDQEIIKRIVEIRTEIKNYLNDERWEVFASDETRMVLEALTRRAWLKKGEKTVIKVERKRESQSYLGLLNQKTFRCQVYALSWQNQEEILQAFRLFLRKYPQKRICIVWDNARFHKGKLIRSALKKGRLLERVHLINFPPYAPNTNPIEHVWKLVKEKLANVQYDTFEKTKQAFLRMMINRKFCYSI